MHSMVPEGIDMAEVAVWFVYGRRVREKLKNAGAVSEQTAKTIEELGLSKREIRTFERNVLIGKIKKTEDGRYYVPCKEEK